MKTYIITDEADCGRCSICSAPIELGDEVVSDTDGVYHVSDIIPDEENY